LPPPSCALLAAEKANALSAIAASTLSQGSASAFFRTAPLTDAWNEPVPSKRDKLRKRYAEDAEYRKAVLARKRASYQRHREEIRERRRRKWAASDPKSKTRRSAYRRAMLRYFYGLSPEDYDRLSARQGGVCAICMRRPVDALCIDHCHRTGRIRGLLCRRCNSALGFFRDDEIRLRSAIAYLRRTCALQAECRTGGAGDVTQRP
jgi:hypothetical protein